MIKNQWYVILESKEVPKNCLIGVKRFGENLVAWRDSDGKLSVFRDKCPHRGIELSKGKILNNHLQCPFHGFEYDASGRCKVIPANGRATAVPDHIRAVAYPLREEHDFIFIWFTPDPENTGMADNATLPPLPWFDDIDVSLVWSGMTDHWKAHYSRAIENQLDIVHVPFIHHNTIGRGIGPVVNGPFTKILENGLSFWPSNANDSGQIPLRHDQVPEPVGKKTYLTFLFPNLWQNHIMDKMRIVVAFVPIDDKNTLFYLRTYQSIVRIPVLREIFFIISNIFNRIVLHQDRRVVETHQPQATQLRMDENLIPGDYPIIQYRKKREELKSRLPDLATE